MLAIPVKQLVAHFVCVLGFADQADKGERAGQGAAQRARAVAAGHQAEGLAGDHLVVRNAGHFAEDIHDAAKATAAAAAILVEHFVAMIQQGILIHGHILPGPYGGGLLLRSHMGQRQAAHGGCAQRNFSGSTQKFTAIHLIHFHCNYSPFINSS